MSQSNPQVWGGRYELLRHVARGGMAEVYLARDLMLDRRVALKVLFPELSTDAAFVERFRREAQAAANLSHPNIVAVYDWGEEEGTYFIVMEFVEGRTLGQIIRGEGPLLADRAAEVGADVAGALAFAHRAGVIHRDVKPGNVLVGDHVKVADFGIARAADTDGDLTQAGAVMGTAAYFSPEQAQGHRIDPRSDLYSLGVVLYETVTGRPPFSGDNPMAIAYKHVREAPVPPRQVNPDVPPALEAVILQAMAKNPNDRYASGEEMRQDLVRFRRGQPVIANPTVLAPALDATRAVTAYEDDASTRTRVAAAVPEEVGRRPGPAAAGGGPPPRRNNGAFIVLLLVMLAVLGGLLYLVARTAGLIGETPPSQVTVPTVIGMTQEKATEALEAEGLQALVELQANDTVESGIVFDQDPKGVARVDRGFDVKILVASERAKVKVFNAVGKKVDDAIDLLETQGFTVTRKDVSNDTIAKDVVISQTPEGGAEAPQGSSVELVVSTGKPMVVVPTVADQDYEAAANEIAGAGFRFKKAEEPSATVEEGKVTRTDPKGGEKAEKGSTVTIYVSSGPEQVTVPNVVGMTEAEAEAALTKVGLKYSRARTVNANPDQDGKVQSQNPQPGSKVEPGSTVTVTVGKALVSGSTTTTSGATTSTSAP